jgi:hypothetical protein
MPSYNDRTPHISPAHTRMSPRHLQVFLQVATTLNTITVNEPNPCLQS